MVSALHTEYHKIMSINVVTLVDLEVRLRAVRLTFKYAIERRVRTKSYYYAVKIPVFWDMTAGRFMYRVCTILHGAIFQQSGIFNSLAVTN